VIAERQPSQLTNELSPTSICEVNQRLRVHPPKCFLYYPNSSGRITPIRIQDHYELDVTYESRNT
jgi:hypothetical protein